MSDKQPQWSRRGILQAVGAGTLTMAIGELFPGRVLGLDPETPTEFTQLPRLKVGRVSQLRASDSTSFEYPRSGEHYAFLLARLGEPAGGGVGPDQDIVAFSMLCTHQGAAMPGGFRPQHAACVCPLHLTSFDLTKHGMVIAGHATSRLPQAVLEIEGDDIFAVGVSGILYGHLTDSLVEPQEEQQ